MCIRDSVYDESNPRSTDAEAATTKFDFADDKLVTLSRADHFANYAEAVAAPSDYTMSEESMNTMYTDHNWSPEDFNDPNDEMPVTGDNHGLKLACLLYTSVPGHQITLLIWGCSSTKPSSRVLAPL